MWAYIMTRHKSSFSAKVARFTQHLIKVDSPGFSQNEVLGLLWIPNTFSIVARPNRQWMRKGRRRRKRRTMSRLLAAGNWARPPGKTRKKAKASETERGKKEGRRQIESREDFVNGCCSFLNTCTFHSTWSITTLIRVEDQWQIALAAIKWHKRFSIKFVTV